METRAISTTRNVGATVRVGLVAQDAYRQPAKSKMSIQALLNDDKENEGVVPKKASTPQERLPIVGPPMKRKRNDNGPSNAHESSDESDLGQRRTVLPPRKRTRGLEEPSMLLQPFIYPVHMLGSRSATHGSTATLPHELYELRNPLCNPPIAMNDSARSQQCIDWTYVPESDSDDHDERDANEKGRLRSSITVSSHRTKPKATCQRSARFIRDSQSDRESFHSRRSSVKGSDEGYEGSSEWEGLSGASSPVRYQDHLISVGSSTAFPNALGHPTNRGRVTPEKPVALCLLHRTACTFSPSVPSPMNSEDWRRVAQAGSSYEPSPLNTADFRVLEERRPLDGARNTPRDSRSLKDLHDPLHSGEFDSVSADGTNVELIPVFDWTGPRFFPESGTGEYSSDNSAYPQINSKMGWIRRWAMEVAQSAEDPPTGEE